MTKWSISKRSFGILLKSWKFDRGCPHEILSTYLIVLHFVFYRIAKSNDIEILRILHQRMDLKNKINAWHSFYFARFQKHPDYRIYVNVSRSQTGASCQFHPPRGSSLLKICILHQEAGQVLAVILLPFSDYRILSQLDMLQNDTGSTNYDHCPICSCFLWANQSK